MRVPKFLIKKLSVLFEEDSIEILQFENFCDSSYEIAYLYRFIKRHEEIPYLLAIFWTMKSLFHLRFYKQKFSY